MLTIWLLQATVAFRRLGPGVEGKAPASRPEGSAGLVKLGGR